jgi:hypothetical protein
MSGVIKKEYRISLDDIFDGGLWDALNKGSRSGHWIDGLEASSPADAAKKALEKVTPALLELFKSVIDVVEED